MGSDRPRGPARTMGGREQPRVTQAASRVAAIRRDDPLARRGGDLQSIYGHSLGRGDGPPGRQILASESARPAWTWALVLLSRPVPGHLPNRKQTGARLTPGARTVCKARIDPVHRRRAASGETRLLLLCRAAARD